MQVKLSRNQIVDLLFALELAEDNAPGMRRWEELRTELRLQLRVQESAMLFPDRWIEDPEPFSDIPEEV